MRLLEMKQIIDENEAKLNAPTFEEYARGTLINVRNFLTAIDGLEHLGKIAFMSPRIKELLNTSMGRIRSDTYTIGKEEHSEYSALFYALKYELQAYKNIANHFATPLSKTTLSLKLYQFDSFQDFRKFNDIIENKILAPLQKLNITRSIGQLEVGSQWMNIILGSSLGVSLIMQITRAVFDVLKHDVQALKLINTLIDRLEKSNKDATDLKEEKEAISKEFYEQQVQLILSNTKADERLSKEDRDYLKELKDDRLKEVESTIEISLKEMKIQVELGLEIHDSIDVPKKERYEMIDYKKLRQVFLPTKPAELHHKEESTGAAEPAEEDPE